MKHLSTQPFCFIVLFALSIGTVIGSENEKKSPDSPDKPAKKASATIESDYLEQLTVTADRLETPRKNVAASVSILKGDEIRRRGYRTVFDALRFVPGVDIRNTGGEGRVASVFLRGSNSSHTKVFVDGVDMSDTTHTSKAVDFGNMSTEDIEKIEIIRGPQSVLYGSDAIGGVINIITKRGKGKLTGYVKFESGSHGTYREAGGISGSEGIFDFRVTLTRDDIRGISAASRFYGNSEKDGYRRTTVGGKFGIKPSEWLDLTGVFKYSGFHTDLDDGSGHGGDDDSRWTEGEHFYFRPQANISMFDGVWKQKIGFSYAQQIRDDRDIDPGFSTRDRFISRIYKVDWQHDLKLHETNTLTFGAEMEREQSSGFSYGWSFGSRDKARRSSCAYYIQDKLTLWENVNIVAGMRVDNSETFDPEVTWRVAPSVWIPETQTKLKGSIGTGFKAPSLYQLYSSSGNPSLLPERSRGWDVGIEQYLFDKSVVVGVTWFENTYDNLIDWAWTGPGMFDGEYQNIGTAMAHGLELEMAWQPIDELRFQANYTYTKARNRDSDIDLDSRPRHKASFHAVIKPIEKLTIDLGCSVVGKRRETYGPDDGWNATQMVWDLSGTYDINDNVQIFGSWHNMLNEKYSSAWGYGTPGCSVYGGMKITF